jgi:DNA-binding transcriptional LysR family regulator
MTGYLRELIQVYCSQHPDVRVQIIEGASADNITAVRRRELDVAFIMDTTHAEGCGTLPLWDERIFVVLPERRALSGKKEIEWSDLRNDASLFVIPSATLHSVTDSRDGWLTAIMIPAYRSSRSAVRP